MHEVPRADEVVARVAESVTGLVREDGPVRRSVKCVLVPCSLREAPLVVKWLFSREPPYVWYAEREARVLQSIAQAPLGVGVPRLVAAGDGWLVMTRLGGRPMAARRHSVIHHPSESLTREQWEALVRAARAIRGWPSAPTIVDEPDDVRAEQMRARVLEDPARPKDWIVDGLARVGAPSVDAAQAALRAHPRVCFQHGDLLLRNVLADGPRLSLVDWECAGMHAEAWDAALLWVWAPTWARDALAQGFAEGAARRAFGACAVFAVARELFYRKRRVADGAVRDRLHEDLVAAEKLLTG